MSGLSGVENVTNGISLRVNGNDVVLRSEARTHLADALREDLDLTGTHLGCEHGICGACTILVDGQPVRGCITLAGCCAGADVQTIEGLDDDKIAAELRAAFKAEHALQCGFCTPGMIMSARDLVLRLAEANETQIRAGMAGNLCRCTGYVGIVRAIQAVILDRRRRGIPPMNGKTTTGPSGAHVVETGVRSDGLESPSADINPRPTRFDPATFAFEPAFSFDQHVTISQPPREVFTLFADVERVAACIPNAFVDSIDEDGHVSGGARFSLGPINALFRGVAYVTHDAETLSGSIVGKGMDGRSNAQAKIDYRIGAGDMPGGCVAQLRIGYSIKGPLAQFSRPGLVQDLAGQIIDDFAHNVERTLAGNAGLRTTFEHRSAWSLAGLVMKSWIRSVLKALWSPRRKP